MHRRMIGHLISFCGTVILIATFITREELRDRWKNTADSLRMAQYIYLLREEPYSFTPHTPARPDMLHGYLMRQGYLTGRLSYTGERDDPRDEFYIKIERKLDSDTINLWHLSRDFENFQIITDKLRTSDPRRILVQSTRQEIRASFERRNQLIESLNITAYPYLGNVYPSGVESTTTELIEMEVNLDNEINRYSRVRYTLVDELLNDADSMVKLQEKRSNIADIVSFALYLLGAVVGFWGRLYDSDKGDQPQSQVTQMSS